MKNIPAILILYLVSIFNPFSLSAQDKDFDLDEELEKTARLIVMITADFEGAPKIGAGIIFGREKDRLLIATAFHILHNGASAPKDILVKLKAAPGKPLKAQMLKHGNEHDIDLAVLSVAGLVKEGINVCLLPFDRLGDVESLEKRDLVYLVGNPNGEAWQMQADADKISQIKGNEIVFQSSSISEGHSGGGLLDAYANLVGMTIADQQPFGRALRIDVVLKQLRLWGYPVPLLNRVVERASTPLHMAADSDNLVAMRDQLELCGSDPNVADYHGATPLHFAARNSSIDAISLLLKAGAKLNVESEWGETPLAEAMRAGHLEVVKFLIKAGARIDFKNSRNGRMAIHWPTTAEILKFLIKSGADINAQDNQKYTPLYFAVLSRKLDIIKILLDAGAKVNVPNNYGDTPLMRAANYGLDEAVALLIKAGADVNALAENGYTPLRYAVANGHKECLKILLKAGADIHEGSALKYSLLDLALRHGKTEIADILRANGAK